jgi:hypothetical protein
MNDTLLASIEREVLSWPGAWKKGDEIGPGGVGVSGYRFARPQLGHLHDDGVADFRFPRSLHDELIGDGRAKPHGAGFPNVVSCYVREPEGVAGAAGLFRTNYERLRAREGRRGR